LKEVIQVERRNSDHSISWLKGEIEVEKRNSGHCIS